MDPIQPISTQICAHNDILYFDSFQIVYMITLSNETWDMILDNLYNERKSLFQCSLVAREWLPTCRYHIFRDHELVLSIQDQSKKTKEVFKNGSCSITPYVRKLMITGNYNVPGATTTFQEPISQLPIFPLVHEVILSHVDWKHMQRKTKAWIIAQLNTAEVLILDMPSLTNPKNLSLLICAAPAMKRLSIRRGACDIVPLSEFNSPPEIQEFQVSYFNMLVVLPLLAAIASHLRHLTLGLAWAGINIH